LRAQREGLFDRADRAGNKPDGHKVACAAY